MTTLADVVQPLSVCMATYNGAAYVRDQLESIVSQLEPDDEVVIVDDASRDGTVEVINSIGDPRIRVVQRQVNRGYVAAFEQAIEMATRDLVLLADQDDIWLAGRVALMRSALLDCAVVAGNLVTLGGPDRITGPWGQDSWRLRSSDSGRTWRNRLAILAGNRPYYGSAMGLNREALRIAIPFPNLPESHDLWIALCGIQLRSMRHLDQPVTARRFHGTNQTPARPRAPLVVLRARLRLLRLIGEARRRASSRATQ